MRTDGEERLGRLLVGGSGTVPSIRPRTPIAVWGAGTTIRAAVRGSEAAEASGEAVPPWVLQRATGPAALATVGSLRRTASGLSWSSLAKGKFLEVGEKNS